MIRTYRSSRSIPSTLRTRRRASGPSFSSLPVAVALTVAVVVLSIWPTDAFAMQFNARVAGTVTDADGNPLAGVKITIALVSNRRIDPIPPTELVSDEDGQFFARNVRVGDSRLMFELEGYETIVMERELKVGAQPRFDVTMVIDEAQVMIEAANQANEHYQAGFDAFMARDFDAAITRLEQALTLVDDTAENAAALGSIHALIGRSHFEQRDFQQAKASYELWIGYQPQEPRAHAELSAALKELGDEDGALTHSERAIELAPDDPVLLYNLGAEMVNGGSVAEGIVFLQRAIEVQPEYPIAHRSLAQAYMQEQRYREAVGAYEKYLEQAPDADDAAEIRDIVAALKEMIG